MPPAAYLLVGLLAGGCSAETATHVVVVLHAEPCVQARARRAAVRTITREGEVTEREARFGDGAEQARWPMRIPLVPRGGDARRVFTIEVLLFDDGSPEPFLVERMQGRFVDGEKREVVRCLTARC